MSACIQPARSPTCSAALPLLDKLAHRRCRPGRRRTQIPERRACVAGARPRRLRLALRVGARRRSLDRGDPVRLEVVDPPGARCWHPEVGLRRGDPGHHEALAFNEWDLAPAGTRWSFAPATRSTARSGHGRVALEQLPAWSERRLGLPIGPRFCIIKVRMQPCSRGRRPGARSSASSIVRADRAADADRIAEPLEPDIADGITSIVTRPRRFSVRPAPATAVAETHGWKQRACGAAGALGQRGHARLFSSFKAVSAPWARS